MNWWLAWIGLFVAAGLGYAASCVWWPYAKCTKCEGAGKFARSDGKVWRDCKRCKKSGARLRVGRKIYNYLHHQKQAAK
jgi:hypothetical protein